MNKIKLISLLWLVFLFAFLLGFFGHDSEVWPFNELKQVKKFFEGNVAEDLSLSQKIENDLNFKPTRHIKVADKNKGRRVSFSEGFESEKHKELNGLKLNPRRRKPKFFLTDQAPQGYRVIFGAFDFEDSLHGAILLDAQGRLAHVWHVSHEGVDSDYQNDTNIFPHGFEISPDGSIVTAFDDGNMLTRYDYCGNIVWRLEGMFHHSIAFEGENAIWTWQYENMNEKIVKIDYNTGVVLEKIPLQKVMEANPDIDIFGILQSDTYEGSSWANVAGGVWHPNDVDPLPKNLEQYYPNFNAGDLLVSLRTPNLIFVMDQKTLKVKWWRQGLTRRQHDPDWNVNGTITIFNNNMHRGYSNITELNPVTFEYRTIIEGSKYDFYTWWRGKHQMMPDGGVLITSTDQGRVFETGADGHLVFEFLNTYGDNEYLAVSEARFLSKDFFKELPQCR